MTEYLKVKAADGTKDLYIELVPVTGGYRINIVKTKDAQGQDFFDFGTTDNPAAGSVIWDADHGNIPPPLTVEHMDGKGVVPVKSW